MLKTMGLLAALVVAAIPSAMAAPTLKWYPSIRSLVYEGAESGTLTVTDAASGVITNAAVAGPRQIVRIVAEDATLANGGYRAVLAASGSGTTLLAKDFVYTNYPWFNSSVGKADVLLPGFTPLKTWGDSIAAVGRRYVFDGGLPREAWSLGEQILARPIAVRFTSEARLKLPAFEVLDASDTQVAFRGGLVRGRVEQDGLIVVRHRLPETTGPVSLEIPLKPEFAKFYHACGDAIRCNPAGAIPAGTGRVFGSRSVRGNGMTLDNFLPYCWIGTDDRGICFAADTDRGWVHGSDRDAVEIHREQDGTVVLMINVIAEPGTHSARTIEFALQVSPVKPMPKGWRGWVDAYDVAGTRNMLCQTSSPIWGCYINGMARYPSFMDWEFVRKMAESARTGKYDSAYLESWIARCLEARKSRPDLVTWLAAKTDDAKAETDLRNHAGAAMKRQRYLATKRKSVFYYYTCDHDPCDTLYEMPVMADEWGAKTAVFGSHQDYAVHYLKEMCENGMSGVYNDNAFLKPIYDWVTGGAWFDDGGRLHPSYGLWSLREFARRQIVAMLEAGVKEPWLTIHHTNANVLPILSFATNTMGMEDKYGSSGSQLDWQDRWSRDYVRTVNQGRQCGVFPTSIEGPFYDRADRTRLTRTMLATLLPHEIQPTLSQACDTATVIKALKIKQEFGVGSNDCQYAAYYDERNPVTQARADVMVSVYGRGAELLLVVGSYLTDAVTLPIVLKRGEILAARDAETGAELPLRKGGTAIDLPRHGFAMVRLTVNPAPDFGRQGTVLRLK